MNSSASEQAQDKPSGIQREIRRVCQPVGAQCGLCGLGGNGEDAYSMLSFSVDYGIRGLYRPGIYICDACNAVVVDGDKGVEAEGVDT